MKVDGSEGANLINIQYGVCFGVIFALCFYLEQNGNNFNVVFTIPENNFYKFIGLLFYFFLDWGHANFLKNKIEFTFWRILAWSIAIWYLGFSVIATNNLSVFKYIIISSYVSIAGLYHFISYNVNYEKTLYAISEGSWMLGLSLSAIIGLIGFVFLYNAILTFYNLIPLKIDGLEEFLACVIVALNIIKGISIYNLHVHLGEKFHR